MLILGLFFINIQCSDNQKLCTQPGTDKIAGIKDGFRYELWNQYSQGSACMTLGDGALFSGKWSGVENYLARRGLEYDQTQKHEKIGTFWANYACRYKPKSLKGGNSYLSVYGWTVEPLVEYYIIEDWCKWIPSMDKNAIFKGTVNADGSTYDIYKNTRINQPSIKGNATFQQYFSIRRDRRSSGSINISNHFKKWESLGMNMGRIHEVSFVVEGYRSCGSFDFKRLDISCK